MAYIGKEPTVGNFQKCDALNASATADYTLQVGSSNVSPESVNHMIVSLNGVIQSPTTAYTVSGSTLSFASALTSNDTIDFVMLLGNVLDIGTPSDDTVTLAKMASGTDGNIISYDTSGNPVAVATGTDGQVLTSSGAGAVCAFEDAPGGGKIGQVLQAVVTATIQFTSTTFADVSGITVNITPAATSSKILVMCDTHTSLASGHRYCLKLVRDSTDIYVGDAASSRSRSSAGGGFDGAANDLNLWGRTSIYLDSPSTISATTYKLQARTQGGNLYFNRTQQDQDYARTARTASSITVMEVLA